VARIRTIKPEFFTSEDIFGLTPLARLFYVSLWCEADREGRLEWKLGTLKARYLPADNCDISVLAQELIDMGLIVLYEVDGKKYAEIPTFVEHQVINNREAPSKIPARVPHASGTRESVVKAEGKGKEGKEGSDASNDDATNPPLPASPSRIGEICILLRRAGVNTSPDAVSKAEWSANPKVSDIVLDDALVLAKKRSPRQITPAYLTPIIADLLAKLDAAQSAQLVAGKDYV
jgi:hypothetical protein